MQTIVERLFDQLKRNNEILGILEFGTDHEPDGYTKGDLDLYLFMKNRDVPADRLFFAVDGFCIDIQIRSAELFLKNESASFDSVIATGRIIYDPTGRVYSFVRQVKSRPLLQKVDRQYTDLSRIAHKIALGKLRGRLDAEPTLCHVLLSAHIGLLCKDYFRIRGIETYGAWGGETRTLQYIREQESPLYVAIERFFSVVDIKEKLRISERIVDLLFAPIGGSLADGMPIAIGESIMNSPLSVFESILGLDSPGKLSQSRPSVSEDTTLM